jgi:hypothetical protein
LEGFAETLNWRADSLVRFGLLGTCLPLVFSLLVMFATGGDKTARYGKWPISFFLCTVGFAWFVSQAALDADTKFIGAQKISAKVEKFFEVENGVEKGDWVNVSSSVELPKKSLKLICKPTQQIKIGDKFEIEVSQDGYVRQFGCSFVQALGLANVYKNWWLFLFILMLVAVFWKIETALERNRK